ncbi:MAG: MarR family winged helix-turn-helix transcriptional regulator [Burkholderiales bacterium]
MPNACPTRAVRRPGSRPSGATRKVDALQALFAETVALFHRLHALAETVHAEGEPSAGKRGVLMSLVRLGPQTVPQLARARPVSRQHIQSLVNALEAQGHVERVDNPAHRRSQLVQINTRGRRLLQAMHRRETHLLKKLRLDIEERELLSAASVLGELRKVLENSPWRQPLKSVVRQLEHRDG